LAKNSSIPAPVRIMNSYCVWIFRTGEAGDT
jgi:hypothetical protein